MNGALTLGVIGHVDHGKTALVRAVTGIETDRLKEERERGLSIVLGFAFIETAHGVVDLIDVPGHEDFVRAMVGGATALDGIVLCVAANEGVMPQTVEHFNIAQLLGVERGFSVLTKTDLVDAEELALARDDLAGFLSGSFLENAPVLEVSAASDIGIESVYAAIETLAAEPVVRDASGRFFLPLDRTFTMRGFGQVVTGTLRGGDLKLGDAVEILPGRRRATVRALQNHNQTVECVSPGQRVAVNLRHVDRNEVKRGDVLAAPGTVVPSTRLDAKLRLLDDATNGLKNGTTVRVLTGTTEAIAKVRLLDRRTLEPGETAVSQLNLDREIATRVAEDFLIRSYSPMHTIGGGQILNANAPRHRRFDQTVTARLETMASGNLAENIEQRLAEAGARGIAVDGLAAELGEGKDALEQALTGLEVTHLAGGVLVETSAYEALSRNILSMIERFHEQEPFKNGVDVGSLVADPLLKASVEVAKHAVKELVASRELTNTDEVLSLAGFDPFTRLDPAQRKLAASIEQQFLSSGIEWLSPEAAIGEDRARHAVLQLLLETGRLVRLRTRDRHSEMIVHASELDRAQTAIEKEFPNPENFALKDIRDLLGSTRKYVVPLMEHLDASGVTVRMGDKRRLRES